MNEKKIEYYQKKSLEDEDLIMKLTKELMVLKTTHGNTNFGMHS